MKEASLKVRRFAPALELPNQKNAAKIFIDSTIIAEFGLSTGQVCVLETADKRREAVAWPPKDKLDHSVALLSTEMRESAGLNLGDVIRISPGGPMPDATQVEVREVTKDTPPLSTLDRSGWEWFLGSRMEAAVYVIPGTTFTDLSVRGPKRSFVVTSVNGRNDSVAKCTASTEVKIADEVVVDGPPAKLEVATIPGLQKQIEDLNDFLADFEYEFQGESLPPASCALVIHGSAGTGKTMLLEQIAATGWGRVVEITDEDKSSTVQDRFQQALEQRSPTIILMDNLHLLIGKQQSTRQPLVKAIAGGLDALAMKAKQLGKRPQVLVVAACLDYLNDIPDALKKPYRFLEHIALPIPDAPARKDIIRSFNPPFAEDQLEQRLSDLSDRTHAYTPQDLKLLFLSALKTGRRRRRSGKAEGGALTWDDMKHALQEVRPTAMHDITLRPRKVRWTDIAGYDEVKRTLQNVLRAPKEGARRRFKPPKGVLMYGPPGCSKTMTAQAMATESGFNFFAVKGGELLNMYVGETERSIRYLFTRAREAAPSIIFFDEIDSLAGTRSRGGTTSNGGVQAVTSLLTEMDGFEERGNVFVLAATNKPEMLDPALIRAGRFDDLIYVPLPDQKAREAILASKAKELELEIDVTELATLATGYSGSEISRICDTAFRDVDESVTSDTAVLEAAIRGTPRRVTPEMLTHFDNWHQSFRP